MPKFTKKKLTVLHEEQRSYLVQTIGRLINDIDSREPTSDELLNLSHQIAGLMDLNYASHEHTKNNTAHAGTNLSYYKIPLIFLAVLYNNKTIFTALTNSFGSQIADLKDEMPGYKGNILHHMFGKASLARQEMQDLVFKCLETNYSKEKIVTMIYERDAKGLNVIDHAKRYGYGLTELITRTNDYERTIATPSVNNTLSHHSFLTSRRRTVSVDAAETLASLMSTV
jgi:hypothetical protein